MKDSIGLILLALFLIIPVSGCMKSREVISKSETIVSAEYSEVVTSVEIQKLEEKEFESEIFSEGHIEAKRKIDIPFLSEGLISKVLVHTGEKVIKGQVIIELDTFLIHNQKVSLDYQISKAELTITQDLLRLGFDPSNVDSIPKEIYHNVELKSDLGILKNELRLMEHKIRESKIKAPYSGVIANLEASEGSYTRSFSKVCTLVDIYNFEVSFVALESEITKIMIGDKVKVYLPLHSKSILDAQIVRLNPIVSDIGTIEVYAKMLGNTAHLLDGLKANVAIKKLTRKQIVVPKTAVLDRQGKLVVFTVKNGLAMWNYVSIKDENSTSYSLESDLSSGDSIIVSDNFNLAHMEPVRIKEK